MAVFVPLAVIGTGLVLDAVGGPILVLIVVAAAAGGAVAALIVHVTGRSAAREAAAVSTTLSAIAAGDLQARAELDAAGDLASLATSLNALAEEFSRRIRQVDEDRRMRDSILSAMEEGVVLVERDAVQYANRAATRILGRTPTDLRSLAPSSLRRLVEEARSGDRGLSVEVETAAPTRNLEAAAAVIGPGDRVLLVLRDVTEQRRVGAMRRDFVADASHELKTPVASIRAAAETVRDAVEDDPESARRFAGRLEIEAERLSRIVSDLLDLSRLETERPEMAEVRLDRVASAEIERFRDPAREEGIDLGVEIEPAAVLGDEKGLALLVANLLDNAIRHTAAGGSVRVMVGAGPDGAVLEVSDTGSGIPSRDLPRIFERFYRVDRARARGTGGTGLGLSIARHVAQQHGGRIDVESELGEGSTFRVVLPVPTP